MNKSIIKDLKNMMLETLAANGTVSVASLIWAIDAKYRLIPKMAEINHALASIPAYRIVRDNNALILSSNGKASSEKLTESDITKALEEYRI